MPEIRQYPNKLGLKGWVIGGKWGPERYLYTLHRVTGLGILLYFVMHIFVTASRAISQEMWEWAMAGVTGTILALEYDLAPDIVTGTVFFSTLCSALSLSVLISLIG